MAVIHDPCPDRAAPREIENNVGPAVAVRVRGAGNLPAWPRPPDISERHPLIRPQFADIPGCRIAHKDVTRPVAVEIADPDHLIALRHRALPAATAGAITRELLTRSTTSRGGWRDRDVQDAVGPLSV